MTTNEFKYFNPNQHFQAFGNHRGPLWIWSQLLLFSISITKHNLWLNVAYGSWFQILEKMWGWQVGLHLPLEKNSHLIQHQNTPKLFGQSCLELLTLYSNQPRDSFDQDFLNKHGGHMRAQWLREVREQYTQNVGHLTCATVVYKSEWYGKKCKEYNSRERKLRTIARPRFAAKSDIQVLTPRSKGHMELDLSIYICLSCFCRIAWILLQ